MNAAISPIDGRYVGKTKSLQIYFSEEALIRYRVMIEIKYFIALCELSEFSMVDGFPKERIPELIQIFESFSSEDAQQVKEIERRTNHDVKAVEYFIKKQFAALGLEQFSEVIHFGLTSQDINNSAVPLLTSDSLTAVMIPALREILKNLQQLANQWATIPMLARTHGQPASPTRLGKEMAVFAERLEDQIQQAEDVQLHIKFGGATGNFNAHIAAYPQIDWVSFANQFADSLGLKRHQTTTQIAHYDDLASLFQAFKRINTILIDLCRDCWTYISMNYFKQKTKAGEVGSSTMPHKVNPIDFENAEGNLGLANALFTHLADKLPISRLQRDLTDSTVLRNIGVPFAHTLIALKSIEKGLGKLELNEKQLDKDLEANWAVVGEAYQTILRREGIANPYELLKDFTRGAGHLDASEMHAFVESLTVSDAVKAELKQITPQNYLGI